MNVLSLFDGMSCGRIALERAGVSVTNYFASEIDKHAIKVAMHNYPDTQQLGDVTKWREWNLPQIDLLIGGSPCQGFSFAGKQLAFDDPRSALFFEYVNILNRIKSLNPNVKFLLENVKMKKEHLTVISRMLDVEPVFINSNLVSAQNRQRYYWCNWDVSQPEDKEIYWCDIMLRDAKGCMFYSEKSFKWLFKSEKRKNSYIEYTDKSKIKMQMVEASHHKGYSNQRCFGVVDGNITRYIHPIECERLQTVPDNYTSCVSNTQRYKMLGNGWTVDVVAHIFSGLPVADQGVLFGKVA